MTHGCFEYLGRSFNLVGSNFGPATDFVRILCQNMCGLMSKVGGWRELDIQDSCPGAFFGLVI